MIHGIARQMGQTSLKAAYLARRVHGSEDKTFCVLGRAGYRSGFRDALLAWLDKLGVEYEVCGKTIRTVSGSVILFRYL